MGLISSEHTFAQAADIHSTGMPNPANQFVLLALALSY
jgi:hypothetical protein